MSIDLELAIKLKERLSELEDRAASDIVNGLCVSKGHDAIPFEYGYSLGYLRALRDCVIVTTEIQDDLIKGEE